LSSKIDFFPKNQLFKTFQKQKPTQNKQANKRKSSDEKTTPAKLVMPDFKRKKTPSKDDSRKMETVTAKVPKMQVKKATKSSRVEPKRALPDFKKIEKELIKKNKPRIDEWGPLEVIKKREFEWPALSPDTKIIWNNPFYQRYSLTKIAVEELEFTLQNSTSTESFDVKRYIEKIIFETQRFIANPFNENIQKQFSFQEAGKIKIWRCPNSAFIFDDDSDTLRVTVAMCKSINSNVTKYHTRKKELTKKEEENREKAPFCEDNSMTDEEPSSSLLSEPSSLADGEKPEDSGAPKAKEKLSSIGEIQDSPCMRYLTRVFANKKQDSFIRRGIGDYYVCAECDKLYWKDFGDFQKSHCNERSLYYNENGAYDASPDLTRQIACAFQGLRRLCPGKAVSASTSVEQILREKRGLKPSSFTNTKTIPEWYHRLFLPSDDFREVMMAPNTAFHLLAILWGEIREMLLEEIEWDKKVNCDYLEGSFKQLRMRYGKNTLKRVIPGVRETCDNCKVQTGALYTV